MPTDSREVARANGSTILSTARESRTGIRTRGSNMGNQGLVLKTDRVTEGNLLTRETCPAGILVVAIDLQLLTGEEEIWRPVVTHLAGMLVVVGAIQCSPGSQALLMVWIEAGKTQK